jgi:TonB family protein
MRKVIAFAFIILMGLSGVSIAQTASDEVSAGRKVIFRVTPACPELARKMHIQGVVRLAAIVKPNGAVKSTRILGGNPVLVEAATEAVAKWKFEAAPNETTEVVQLAFANE